MLAVRDLKVSSKSEMKESLNEETDSAEVIDRSNRKDGFSRAVRICVSTARREDYEKANK